MREHKPIKTSRRNCLNLQFGSEGFFFYEVMYNIAHSSEKAIGMGVFLFSFNSASSIERTQAVQQADGLLRKRTRRNRTTEIE